VERSFNVIKGHSFRVPVFMKWGKSMDRKAEIMERLKQIAGDGRISCTEARKLAEELQVPPREVGALCDEMGIKIFACELGCF